jgi:hypothetical protein
MVMIQVRSKPGGPHVKWTIPQEAQLKLLPAKKGNWDLQSKAYKRQVEEMAQQAIFKEMGVPAFKMHHHTKYINFIKSKKDAKSKLLLSKKTEQAKTRFNAAVEAKAEEKLASTLASLAASGSANNAIDLT